MYADVVSFGRGQLIRLVRHIQQVDVFQPTDLKENSGFLYSLYVAAVGGYNNYIHTELITNGTCRGALM